MRGPGISVRRLPPDDTEAFIGMRREALDLEPSAFLASPDDVMIAALQFARGLEGVTRVHLGVAEGNASALRL
jgi:hypothetical protein